ncbi:MAG: ammonium transporter [Sinobacteraceae bacterium]|nr:ammonium transporter [Nevskiaceae bacterium]
MRIDLAPMTPSRRLRATLPGLLALLPALASAQDAKPVLDTGDTAWMLASTVLVIMMAVPGLALFYGGQVRSKNVLSTSIQVFVVFSLLTVLWVVYGYSLAFTGEGRFIGGFDALLVSNISPDAVSGTIPELLFVAFQATFAAITTALAVGGFAERTKFSAVLIFAVIWFTCSYLVIARAVWGGGWIADLGAIDYAGGTVVHINAGIAGLVGALIVGKRLGYGTTAIQPHNLPYVLTGASLLWVGWFGFNVGSGLGAGVSSGLVLLNTYVCTAAAVIAWVFAEWIFKGKPTVLGAASGAIAGLVAITPSCGSVGVAGAIVLGLIAGVICLWAVASLKKALGYDDSLDVFGVHAVGGIVGALGVAILGAPSFGGVAEIDNIGRQFGVQAISVLFTIVWSTLITVIAFAVAKFTVGLRPGDDTEREGLDLAEHGERAYD